MARFNPLVGLLGLGIILGACGDKDEDTGTPVVEDDDDGGSSDDTGEVESFEDRDHDGYWSDVDCNDNDYSVHPDAEELCDGKDNDCDDVIDEGFDLDGDGEVDAEQCADGTDCNDADATIGASASEVPYDDIDQDCDGEDLIDVDGDGFIGAGAGGNDCDDDDASVYPGAPEVGKDGIDQDCNGVDWFDGDGDGFEDEAEGGEDCDDTDATIFPEAWDWFNDGIDSDCDGADDTNRDFDDARYTITMDAVDASRFGNDIAVCDFDEDGMVDIFVSAREYGEWTTGIFGFYGDVKLYWNSKMESSDADLTVESVDNLMAFQIECADVDGDGHMDLISHRAEFFSGIPDYTHLVGDTGIYVWYGDGTRWTGTIDETDAGATLTYDLGSTDDDTTIYSWTMSSGDLDGDGTAEIIFDVSESSSYDYGFSALAVLPGAAYSGELLLGDYWTAQIYSGDENTIFKSRVIEDFTGDGFNELVVFEPDLGTDGGSGSYDGTLSLLSGFSAGQTFVSDSAFATIEGYDGTYFGYDAAFGDFDGDGTLDAAVGVPTDSSRESGGGAIYVYNDIATSWASSGIDGIATATASATGSYESGQLGLRVYSVGDLNGDGSDDVLALEVYGGSKQEGQLYLLSGAEMTGTDYTPEQWSIMTWDFENGYGLTATAGTAAVGDIDGDGTNDVVIGAQDYDPSGSTTTVGKVYLVLSSEWTGG